MTEGLEIYKPYNRKFKLGNGIETEAPLLSNGALPQQMEGKNFRNCIQLLPSTVLVVKY